MPQELGADVVRVLSRNADLFRAIAGAGTVEDEARQEEGSLEQRLAEGEAASTREESRTARALSLPTPGGSGGVQGVLGGAGEMRHTASRALCVEQEGNSQSFFCAKCQREMETEIERGRMYMYT